LDPPGTASEPEKPVRADIQPSPELIALQERIEKQAGGRANYENLAAQTLDASDSMMSRAYALRRLAERFPAANESLMTASDRQVLRQLYLEHASALAKQAGEMERLLRPVLAPLSGRVTVGTLPAASSWQAGTENLFTIAHRVETLLAVILGVAPGDAVGKDVPSQVLSSLAQLRASADAYGPAAGSSESKP
jgi:hypothetical protein